MTIANCSSNGPIGVDAPERKPAGISDSIGHPVRLTAVGRPALMDTPAEQAFGRLTRLAAKIMRAPVALLSLVDGEGSFFKSSVGLPERWASRGEMPLSQSVCQHVVAVNAPLIINDTRGHPQITNNQAVAELRIVRLLSAMQGRLGLDLAREHHPDVIFLDLHLPDLQGDAVLRRLRDGAATHDSPVIILSADATPRQIERLLAAGARHYLVKPLNVKEFLQILDATLNERKQ